MPYLVLVHCADEKAAEIVVNANHPDDGTRHRVVGVYDMPRVDDNTCAGFRCTKNSWTRAPGGHMVHSCGRRHPEWRRRLVGSLLDYVGRNLLNRDKTPKVFQNPKGWTEPPLFL